jgi:FMN-dependent NADH-azoreductase
MGRCRWRGWRHVKNPAMQTSFLTPCLQAIFEKIGIHSLESVRVEGIAPGAEAVALALDTADAWIEWRLPQLLADR